MLRSKLQPCVSKGHFIVKNDRGLHTRPCTEIVKCTTKYRSEVRLGLNKSFVNAKSILGIMMLAASRGSKIHIEAEGDDAEQVVNALIELANLQFHMKY